MTEHADERFKRPNVEAPLIVWEYAMTLERWVVNAEGRVEALRELLREAWGFPEYPHPAEGEVSTDAVSEAQDAWKLEYEVLNHNIEAALDG